MVAVWNRNYIYIIYFVVICNVVHQEAEQPVGRGGCFPGENAKRTRERKDGRDQDPVRSGRH